MSSKIKCMSNQIAPEKVNSYLIEDLGQIDPRELGAGVPILWSDWPMENRPYSTPIEEWIRSPNPISMKQLRERWLGLFDDNDLAMMRETPQLRAQRMQFQDELMQSALTNSISGDIDFQTRRLDREIIDLVSLIEGVNTDIELGYEYRPAKGKDAGLGYVKQPLSVDSKSKLINARIALSNTIATRLGLANDIVKMTVAPEKSLEERMTVLMMRTDPEFEQIQNALKNNKVLGEGILTASAGDAIESNRRAEKAAGRVIDSTPLPRLEDLQDDE